MGWGEGFKGKRMLGYVLSETPGMADRLLADLAAELRGAGFPVAGTVQINTETAGAARCDMDLQVLTGGRMVRISQRLGPHSRGCRLDPAGLEEAVGLVAEVLAGPARPRLLIVNKFGKQEVEGRGFRPLIGQALAEGIAVLTAVGRGHLAGFEAFAGGLAECLPAEPAALRAWCARAAA